MDIDQNGYSRLDAPEPTSASNSPAAEIPDALTGAVAAGTGNGMDVDEDEDVDGQGVGDGGDDDDDDDDAPAPAPDQQQQQQHARSSIETRTQTLTLTNGESVGVQSDKVRELGPETSLLCVPDKIVMHTAWNPQDPQILATGGDALCRIWTVSTKSIQSPEGTCPERQQQQQFVDTLDPSDTSLITAMAWSSDGEILAVATRSDTPGSTGGVSLWDKTGRSRDELMTVPDMILMFRWNPSGTHLLGITSSGRGRSALVVWDTRSSDAMCPLELQDIVTDAAWSDDQKFTICGHNRIVQMSIETQSIVALHSRTEEEKYQSWTHIRFDAASNTTAIAAEESAVLGIIDARGNLKTTTAHDAEITALAYQPISNPSSYTFTSPRLLATSSLDGNVRIWDANQPFTTVHVLSLGHSTPPMAISFTPDGYLVAAASWNRVLIWNAEIGGMPKASWKGEPGKWQSLGVNGVDQDSGIGEEDEGPTHSLSWDADGGKLAYGLGSQVCLFPVRVQQSQERRLISEDCDYQLSTLVRACRNVNVKLDFSRRFLPDEPS